MEVCIRKRAHQSVVLLCVLITQRASKVFGLIIATEFALVMVGCFYEQVGPALVNFLCQSVLSDPAIVQRV